jgi:hypothetical protein
LVIRQARGGDEGATEGFRVARGIALIDDLSTLALCAVSGSGAQGRFARKDLP